MGKRGERDGERERREAVDSPTHFDSFLPAWVRERGGKGVDVSRGEREPRGGYYSASSIEVRFLRCLSSFIRLVLY